MKVGTGDFGIGLLLGALLGLVSGLLTGVAVEIWLFPKGLIYDYQTLIAGLIAATFAFATVWQIRHQLHQREQEVSRTHLAKRRANRAMLKASSVALRSAMKAVSDEIWPLYNLMELHQTPLGEWKALAEVRLDRDFMTVMKDNIEWEDKERNEVLTDLLDAVNRTHYGVWAWNEKLFQESRVDPNRKKDLAVMLVSAAEAYTRISKLMSEDNVPKLSFDDVFQSSHLLSRTLLNPNIHVDYIACLNEWFGKSEIFLRGDNSTSVGD